MEPTAKPSNRQTVKLPSGDGGPDMVRIAPGRHAWVPANGGEPPALALCRWTPDGEGAFRPVPVGGRWARLDEGLARLLGFRSGAASRKYETLYRLARAGFIDMVKVSPACWLLDLDSWHRHLVRCIEDPDLWEEGGDALREYRFANGLGPKACRVAERRQPLRNAECTMQNAQ